MKMSSIRVRLPASYALIALLTMGVLGGILFFSLQNFYKLQERSYLENSAALMNPGIAKVMEAGESSQTLQGYIHSLSFLIQARIRLIDPEENVVADSGSLQTQSFIYTNLTPYGMGAEVLHEGRTDRYIFNLTLKVADENQVLGTLGENTVLLSQLPTENTLFGFGLGSMESLSPQHTDQVIRMPVYSSTGQPLGTLEVSEGLAFGRTIIENVARAWMIAGLVAVVVAGTTGWIVSRRLVSPLTDLIETTQQMSGGDLSARVKIETRDELNVLGESFNAMAEQVEDTVTTLRRFVADAAHELHTPITTLGVNLELASEEDQDLHKYLENAQNQTRRMQTLVDNLLDLSRIEAGNMEPTTFSLGKLVEEIEQKYAEEADSQGISLRLEIDTPKGEDQIYGDLNKVRRAIDNLVDNALKFTDKGGEVRLRLEDYDGVPCLTIRDTGIGIPAEDMANIFQRFHRGRNASSYPGSGLGLAIVKAIFDQHQAEIEVLSGGNGTRVRVTFKR
ncbi:MAG: HAMP domain-containing sensor histidine kinase [Anaerolineales bacterium]|jgi:signal transduction histidine kinase